MQGGDPSASDAVPESVREWLSGWTEAHTQELFWIGLSSLAVFVGSLLLLPWLVARIPADYFAERRPPVHPFVARHPLVRLALRAARNALGLVLVLLGVAMLLLPGQGLLTILGGLVLLEFPGKRELELALVRQRSVRAALDWVRARAGAEPLRVAPRARRRGGRSP